MSHIHIDVEHVSFSYDGKRQILDDISFFAGEHESIGLVGVNGVGKSTLLKLLVGLAPHFTGSVRVEEIPLEKNTVDRVREKIGYVFQDSDSQLFMPTVCEDVAFAPRNYGLPEDEVERRVKQALAATGITHLADRQIYRLSGGEKKLAAVATVLSMTPDMMLMDEPSAALDPRNRRNLIGILNGFSHLKIIASHDLDFIWDTCGRTILMAGGRIVRDGDTKDVLSDEALLLANGLELPLSLQRR